MFQDLQTHHFWFLDQDVLNKHLVGKVKFIDHAWNTIAINEAHLHHLSPVDLGLYHASLKLPKIIHFAGINKPWKSSHHPFNHYYWYYLRSTIWYEKMLFQYVASFSSKPKRGSQENSPSLARKILNAIWQPLPMPVKIIMQPLATKLGKIIK
jgi:lipopolysaccharide biosynthesis glycosyltransferase